MCNSIDMHSLIRKAYWCVLTKLKVASMYPFILYLYNLDSLTKYQKVFKCPQIYQFVKFNCTDKIRKSIEIPHKITYHTIVYDSLNRNLY